MRRTGKAIGSLAAATSLAMIGGGLAFADGVISDGDGVAPVTDQNWSLGTVCTSSTGNRNIPVAVTRSNHSATHNQTFANGASVSITRTAGAGLTVEAGPKTITLPSDWTSRSTGTVSSSISFNVAYTAPAAPGDFTATVTFTGSGRAGDGGTLTKTDNLAVSGTAAVCDTTPPVIVPNVAGTQGNGGWYTGNVSVSWTVTDPESSVSSSNGCSAFSITSDQAATTYTCTATSAGGNASRSVTVKRDATPPTVTPGSVAGTAGTSPWLLSDASVPFTATDTGSGLADSARARFSVPSTGEGAGLNVSSGSVSDAAGNTNSASVSVAVDKTDPSVSASLDRAAATTGWFNIATGAPTVFYECTAGGSPLSADCPGSHTFAEGANQSHSRTVFGASGRSNSDGVSGISVDLTAPAIDGADVPAGAWTASDVFADFTARDQGSGIHVADEAFRLTASAESASAAEPTVASKTVMDAAGNSTTRTLRALIDKSGPSISGSDVTATGWRNTALSAEFTASDSRSGLADSDDGSFTLTTSGDSPNASTAVTTSRTVADAVGNETTRTISAKVDSVKPSSTVSGVSEGAVYTSVPSVSCAGSDALSGIATSGTVSGAGTAPGRHTVTCNGATDNAGNVQTAASAPVSYLIAGLGKYSKNFDGTSVPKAKAGSALPLGWAVTDGTTNYALLSTASVSSVAISSCTDDVGIANTEAAEVAAGGSGLQLLPDSSYQVNVKTSSTQTGCRRFTVTMTTTSGSTLSRSVNVQLVK